MIAIDDSEGRRAIITRRLRLTFEWTGDRWSHALDRGGGAVVRSVESDPGRERDEPARVVSPAYQQMSVQRAGDDVQALLVGQAGAHHFSAAFTVREDGDETIVEVDVADRCRAESEAPACTYAVGLTSGDLRDADPGQIIWERAGDRLTLASAEPPALLTLAEAGRAATRVQALATAGPGSATRRWAYRWIVGPQGNLAP